MGAFSPPETVGTPGPPGGSKNFFPMEFFERTHLQSYEPEGTLFWEKDLFVDFRDEKLENDLKTTYPIGSMYGIVTSFS